MESSKHISKVYTLDQIRKEIIGNDMVFKTPFGDRNLFYADYTASGRGLTFVENKITNILNSYANTHTEDDYSGKFMTTLLHESEIKIKELVNAGESGKIISVGAGATGALLKLQQILGIYSPPATRERFKIGIENSNCSDCNIIEKYNEDTPVIFVGPYEHHSNEVMWRESHSTVVVIKLNDKGLLDLDYLEEKLTDSKYKDRKKLASFSAGSNITGLLTNVYDVAKLCHKYNTPILFDYAAIAPYIDINMNKDKDSYFDAIFFSPHKFIGGPGTSGILIFNEKLYRNDLAPTAGGGGTVDYVGTKFHDFTEDIETREKAGTPPILQTIKTALVMDLKEKISVEVIDKIEEKHLKKFFEWADKNDDKISLIGKIPINNRVPIISFNLKHKDRYFHPKFVTKLLNDLFGIQSRAGCSCAGPYGHYLLGIDEARSSKYRAIISKGYSALKPGWVRVNLHYLFKEEDIDFITDALDFIIKNGNYFLSKYRLDMVNGEWKYIGFKEREINISIDETFEVERINLENIVNIRKEYFSFAEKFVNEIKNDEQKNIDEYVTDADEVEDLKFFYYKK